MWVVLGEILGVPVALQALCRLPSTPQLGSLPNARQLPVHAAASCHLTTDRASKSTWSIRLFLRAPAWSHTHATHLTMAVAPFGQMVCLIYFHGDGHSSRFPHPMPWAAGLVVRIARQPHTEAVHACLAPMQEHAITSDDALVLDELPGHSVLIVGAGYISVEFSSIYKGLGADVHLMYRKPLPLTGWGHGSGTQQCSLPPP